MCAPVRLIVRRRFRPRLEALEDRRLLAVYTVLNGADAGEGSLRWAVEQANATSGGDAIEFDPAVAQVALSTGQLKLTDDVTITGPAEGVTIARDPAAASEFRLVEVAGGVNAELSHLVLTGGVISDEPTGWGGGIFNAGTLTLTACTLSGNSTGNVGGGIYSKGPLTIAASTVSDNSTAQQGGGICNDGGSLTVTGSTIRDNLCGDDGGGILSWGGPLTVTASTFSGNSAAYGGGIESSGVVTVTQCTFSGNSAECEGGGIWYGGTMLTVTASTFSGNAAPQGGSVLLYGWEWEPAAATLNNTLVANSVGGDLATGEGGVFQGAGNLVEDGSGGLNDPGGTFTGLTGEPGLDPVLADNGGLTQTHALLPGSRALDAGRDDLAVDPDGQPLTTDQRGDGFARIVGPHTDIGALELQTTPRLTGLVFVDYDADGDLEGPDDLARAGVPVYLDVNGNGRCDPGEPATATGPDGRYTFANPGSGPFTVRLDLPPEHGVIIAAPAGGAHVQVVPGAGDVDFGLVLVSPVVPVSAAEVLFPPSPDPETAYVQGLYRNVLGREADADGLAYWVGQLRSGVGRDAVAEGVWKSPEHRTLQVRQYYRTHLHREGDAGGVAYHVGLFLSGHAETDVVLDFLTSAEYQGAHATDEAFVRGLYEDVLGRTADAAGLASWMDQLAAGASRLVVAQQVEVSDESYLRMLDGYYAALLHRPADAAGSSYWLGRLRRGTVPASAVAAGSHQGGPDSPAAVAQSFLAGAEYETAARAAVT